MRSPSFNGFFVSEICLSPFHSELLQFLLRNCEKQMADEGVDPSSDPHLRTLLKDLSPTSADEPLPLSEIIDNYQHLFGSKGPVHIEKTLMESFPVSDFIELGLTRYYPRIYRGLPRLYNRDQATQAHIKKNFTHLPSLKKQALSRALFSLYGKMPAKGKVTLFTWVINDGLGDFIAAVEVMRLLKGRLPELDLHFVGLVQEKALANLNLPEQSVVIPYERECPFSMITEEAMETLRSSDLILQIPTYYPHTDELEKAMGIDGPKIECVGEYGFLESNWFHPKSGHYSLGLHFLEKGVLTRKPCGANWEDVKNEQLQRWRCPENRFYLAYLASPIGGAIYLHSLLKSLENDPVGIDLCVPDLGWFIQFSEKQNKAGRPILEWDLGVSSIEIHFQDQLYAIEVAPQGKKLRLLCPGLITQSDFRALLALSGDWVAIRGNQSFSEAISQGKAFFYDGREHARYFIKDLAALAENRIGAYHGTLSCVRGMAQGFVYNLPVEEADWVEETFFQDLEEWTSIALHMGLALQDPETIEGYKELNRILVEEFSANPFLCHLVQRGLCHRQQPDLERFESEQMALFTSQKISFSEWIRNLRMALSESCQKSGCV
jgi:hypothetical protein